MIETQKQEQNEFEPDVAFPPGVFLEELLDERGMTQRELADRTGKSKKAINEIVSGKAPINAQTALELEKVLGPPAHWWSNLELQYREHLARERERERLSAFVSWAQRFPVRELRNLGVLPPRKGIKNVATVQDLLRFFGVSSPEQWQRFWATQTVRFRRPGAGEQNLEALSAWLRWGEAQAQKLEMAPYSERGFEAALAEIRGLTTESPDAFVPRVRERCAQAGVAFVILPLIPKAGISGVTRWLAPDRALLQMSLRYRKDDHFWFTFFHEAAHILKHRKKAIFLEGDRGGSREEQEANRFAADLLIPPAEYQREFGEVGPRISKAQVRAFAARVGVAPGIVVGRLQHEGRIPFSHLNGLKRTFEWAW